MLEQNGRQCWKAQLMLRFFVERLMNMRCCYEQEAAAYRTVLYTNHYSEDPGGEEDSVADVHWTSATLSSSPDPRSSRRNRHRRHAWKRVVPLAQALTGDQRSAVEGLGRLAAMRAWGGRAATVGPVEERKGRRPCRASAHAARSSRDRGNDGAGTGTATGDAPERDGRASAARGHPRERTVLDDGGVAVAASTTESLTATDQGRRRRDRIRRRDAWTSATLSSSPDPRSSRRNRHRRHAWQRVVSLGRALIGDQRFTLEGLGRLAAMRAWGGRAATVRPVEEREGRRPCRASAHAARSSRGRGDDGAGTGTATGDAPERDGRALAARGHPRERTVLDVGGGASAASTTKVLTATDQGRRRRDRIRRRGGRTSASPSSSPDPRSSRRIRHRWHAKQRAVPLGRVLIRDQRPAPEGEGRLGAMHARGGKAATVGSVEEGEGRRPCRASAHAARSSRGRGDDGAGTGTATGDAPERDGHALAARGHPRKRTVLDDSGAAVAALTTESLTSTDQGRRRRDRIRRRDGRTSASPSSSHHPRSSRRIRHRRHA